MKRYLENESGTFVCDSEGRCHSFLSGINEKNNLSSRFGTGHGMILKKLIIPEGITQIGDFDYFSDIFDFRDMIILDEIQFPSSLKIIGDCCLADSLLPEVIFPSSLEKMGAYAFGHSRIRRLVFPENARKWKMVYPIDDALCHPPADTIWCPGRGFKDSTIDTLEYPEHFILPWNFGVEVTIGEKIVHG